MAELSYKSKIAVVKLLNEILNVDKVVHKKEVEYLDDVINSFALEQNYEDEVNAMITLEALSTIRGLSVEQKEEVAKMMGNMIVVDNDINYNEVKLYHAFCESCDIDKDFNVDDYSDVTLSGPFVNPEDILNMS